MQSNILQQSSKLHRWVICLLSLNSEPTDPGPALLNWSWTSASFPCHLGECCTSPADSNEVSFSPVLFLMKSLRSWTPARPHTPWPDSYQKPLLSSSETQPSSKKTVLWSSTGQLSSNQSVKAGKWNSPCGSHSHTLCPELHREERCSLLIFGYMVFFLRLRTPSRFCNYPI